MSVTVTAHDDIPFPDDLVALAERAQRSEAGEPVASLTH